MRTIKSIINILCFATSFVSCGETLEKLEVPVASITISRESIELVEGESIVLAATVSPSDATDKKVSWSSSKSSVASVDQKGTVTALSVGSATVTASAGGKNSLCNVTVSARTIAVSSITLDKTELSLNVGEEYQLKATIEPSNASDQNVKWSSVSSSIASVNEGLIKGIKIGETKITASVGGHSAVCTVKVSEIDYSKEYLTIEVLSDGSIIYDSYGFSLKNPIEISTDGVTWKKINPSEQPFYKYSMGVKKGDRIHIRGSNYCYASPINVYTEPWYGFESLSFKTGDGARIKVYGNILSIIDYDFESLDLFPTGCVYAFARLFAGCEGLISAKDLVLPKNTMAFCYAEMFADCRNLTEGPSLPATRLTEGCYNGMFYRCKNLTISPSLPAKSLAKSCYSHMFSGCAKLTTPPELPAIDLTDYCYQGMFAGSGLTKSPELPAEVIPLNAYYAMFSGCQDLVSIGTINARKTVFYPNNIHPNDGHLGGMFSYCTSLKEFPDLLLTTLNKKCCQGMFEGCTNLTKAPGLPATILSDSCYEGMFSECTSLSKAPVLPATNLASLCYANMFSGCTSLVEAPVLPAKELGDYCYKSMFEGCTSLKTAPNLPATSMTRGCYYRMFAECSSLQKAPDVLPAMSLAESCYEEMFYNCRYLTTAPVLPAISLAKSSYSKMFTSCLRLNYVKALFIELPPTNVPGDKGYPTLLWLSGVAGEGTFVKNVSAKWDVISTSVVPNGWTIEYASE